MANNAALANNFTLSRFNDTKHAVTKTGWLQTASDNGIFDLDYRRAIDAVLSHMDYTSKANGDYLSYGVFDKGSDCAEGIVSIVYSPKPGAARGWLKMLEVKLSPAYDELMVAGDLDLLQKAIWVYGAAILGTLALRDVHKASVVKLYGRNESLLKFLTALGGAIKSKNVPSLNVAIEGRWLVITKV